MKKILLTGKNGFLGRNLLYSLQQKYNIYAPSREELDVRNSHAVESILKQGSFDAVIHLANPNPTKNPLHDNSASMLSDSLRIFLNFARCSDLFGKMVYFGSGAELDKSRDLHMVNESLFGTSIPNDTYGFGKFVMQEVAQNYSNIYNLRLFACYGPTDHESKFITHAIHCCQNNKAVTIRQNCMFDYLYVMDVLPYLTFILDMNPKYNTYNCCSGSQYSLKEIGEEVCRQMENQLPIMIFEDGWNKEYTASNQRFLNEVNGVFSPLPLKDGIARQIEWLRSHQL